MSGAAAPGSATTLGLDHHPRTVYAGTETRSGWTVGVGGEYAFTNVLSGFVEYGYYDYGSGRVPLTPLIAGLRPGLVDVKETTSVVRAGLNIRFGGLRGY